MESVQAGEFWLETRGSWPVKETLCGKGLQKRTTTTKSKQTNKQPDWFPYLPLAAMLPCQGRLLSPWECKSKLNFFYKLLLVLVFYYSNRNVINTDEAVRIKVKFHQRTV